MPSLTDEVIRYSSPILYFRRTVTADTDAWAAPSCTKATRSSCGTPLQTFDEAQFPDAQAFLADRPQVPAHVAFGGGGAHFCLGASLARLEVAILIEELVMRNLSLEIGDPLFVPSNFVNGIEHLPVTIIT